MDWVFSPVLFGGGIFFKAKKGAALGIQGLVLSSCSFVFSDDATSNTVGSKVGTAKATGYLGLIFLDQDASIKSAAKNGGISKISTVDIKQTSLLNLIVTDETIVTGE